MTTLELIRKTENATSIDEGTIDINDVLATCGYWDSLCYIIFMSMVERELGLKLVGKEVEKAKTVGDLMALCKSKLNDE